MQPTTTDNLQHFALDGPVTLPIAVLVVLLLLALFAWSLRRQQSVIGKANARFFWVLRATALGVVMWMLLAPATVSVERSTSRQSVAFFTDVSGSMATVDPDGTADDLRWAIASDDGPDTATAAADRALAAAGIAQRRLQIAANTLREHQPESHVVDATIAARNAIERVRHNIDIVIEQLGRRQSAKTQTAAPESSLAARIRKMLDGPDFQSFTDLSRALERGRTPSQKGWRESLPDLEHRMAGIRRRLIELARSVAAGEQELWKQENPESMAAVRQSSRVSRVGRFVESLHNEVLAPLREKANVRYSVFDAGVTALSQQDSPKTGIEQIANKSPRSNDERGLKTNLSAIFEQLGRSRRQHPLAAAFVSTDAIHNDLDSTDPRQLAADLQGTQVYVVPIGNTRHVRDVILQSVLAPNIAMRNDDVVIEAILQAHDCAGETCTVQLMQGGEVLDRQDVDFDSAATTQTVRFERRLSEVGVHQYQVSVIPLDDELTDENNFDHFQVNVTRSEIKVLLADEMPRWEYRYLAQLFRRAPKMQCDELLFRPRMVATGKRAATSSFPVTVDDWDQYDVVILGDLATEHLPVVAQETLIEYLRERGGTLIMIAGHQSMPHAYASHPLADVLPVKPIETDDTPLDDFAFYLTQLGSDHDALTIGENLEATRLAWEFVNRNVPLSTLSRYRHPLPTARTLIAAVPRTSTDEEADAKNSAFLCWQPVKRGRIIYLSGGETYRLRFLRGDRLHFPLWGQLLRWTIANDLATGSDQVRIRTDKSRYKRDEAVQVLVRLADSDGGAVLGSKVEAIATRADDQRFVTPLIADEEIPGQYRGEFAQLDPGVYRIEPSGAVVESLIDDPQQSVTASFTVRADLPLELLDTRCDLALAHQIADATGGQVLPPTAVAEVIGLTDLEPEVSETVENRPLWVQWKFLWIAFACLQTEWIIRKWKGLS
jgi:hypothetical protein